MKHRFILAAVLAASFGTNAASADSFEIADSCADCGAVETLPVKYVKDALVLDGWRSNWFLGVQGGASAFAGDPLGCDDLFGRVRPLVRGYAGKWFTPSVGTRVVFEGLRFQDYAGSNQDYQAYHIDLLWNLLGRPYDTLGRQRWSLSPYLGAGFVHTDMHYHSPFAINYGVVAAYSMTDRLKLNLEVSGMSTTSSLDNYPGKHKLSDNFVGVSVGLSYTIGKCGWRQVVDAEPYIISYEDCIKNRHVIEYQVFNEDLAVGARPPKNDYSGLRSLMARIRGVNYGLRIDGDEPDGSDLLFESDDSELSVEQLEAFFNSGEYISVDSLGTDTGTKDVRYLKLLSEKGTCIGAPVFFFFVIGTDRLVDEAQLVNLDEISRLAKKYGLKIRVKGSADSATGSGAVNKVLSEKRADFIVRELEKRGIDSGSISRQAAGGIDKYSPDKANRLTIVELYF